MRKQSIAKQLEAIDKAYSDAVDALANRVRDELVIPYCERTGYRFTAGMGSWGFDGGAKRNRYGAEIHFGSWVWETDAEAKRAIGARMWEAFGLSVYQGQQLASVIPDYTPTTYKAS